MTQFTDDVIECAKLVQSRDPIRFRAAMAAPLPLRTRLFTLFAFNIEMSKAAWASKEPMIAEMRLQWWYDALDEIAKGGLVRRHYVITPLALAITPDQAKSYKHLSKRGVGISTPIRSTATRRCKATCAPPLSHCIRWPPTIAPRRSQTWQPRLVLPTFYAPCQCCSSIRKSPSTTVGPTLCAHWPSGRIRF